jgi:hypothetical protein
MRNRELHPFRINIIPSTSVPITVLHVQEEFVLMSSDKDEGRGCTGKCWLWRIRRPWWEYFLHRTPRNVLTLNPNLDPVLSRLSGREAYKVAGGGLGRGLNCESNSCAFRRSFRRLGNVVDLYWDWVIFGRDMETSVPLEVLFGKGIRFLA